MVWTYTKFEPKLIETKIFFKEPLLVSRSQKYPDTMYVEFVKTNWMISAESFKPISEFEVIKTKMPI